MFDKIIELYHVLFKTKYYYFSKDKDKINQIHYTTDENGKLIEIPNPEKNNKE